MMVSNGGKQWWPLRAQEAGQLVQVPCRRRGERDTSQRVVHSGTRPGVTEAANLYPESVREGGQGRDSSHQDHQGAGPAEAPVACRLPRNPLAARPEHMALHPEPERGGYHRWPGWLR